MSDALWAAREGDALMHTSMMADIVGGVLEVAANVAIGALATAAVAAAAGITIATGGLGACLLGAVVGVVVGVVMAKTGADKGLSRLCEGIGNGLFPPSVQARVSSGSEDTFTNGIPSARAAGAVPPGVQAGGSETSPEPSYLDMAKGFFSQMWRPTVASPAPGAIPLPLDTVLCEKHPPMPEQYLAEGSDKVAINGQPAVRSGDRSTCEAVVVEAGDISPNVRIGGGKLVVREIRSGKTPGVGLAVTALMMLKGGKGKFWSNLPCMLLAGANSFVTSTAISAATNAIVASTNPVHAATGAKVLGGDDELDFIVPANLPIAWRRFYNSRDERGDGMFGPGWSVAYEISVQQVAGADGHTLLYTDEQGRRIDMGWVAPGSGTYSAGEGLAVRHHEDGQLLIESEDGLYRLFEPCTDTRWRLVQLGDRNENRIHLDHDALGRLVRLRETHGLAMAELRYGELHTGRVEQVERLYPDGSRESLVSYGYDAGGRLERVSDSEGHVHRRFAYDAAGRMVEHQLAAGLRCFYEWHPYEDGHWRVVRHWTDEGDEYHFDYDLDQACLRITDNLQRTSLRRWNQDLQIVESSDALGNTWRFVWNDERQLVAATDPKGGRWSYAYDETGNLCRSTDPLGRNESTLWLEHWSLPLAETDAAGHCWRYRYDARGNRTHETDPLGHTTRYGYDARGNLVEVIDAGGQRTTLRWNDLGQLLERVDCSGYPTRQVWDRRGLLSAVIDALGERTEYHYDSLGRLQSRRTADGRVERYERNAIGQLTARVDAAGHPTLYRYDRRGQVTRRTDAQGRNVGFEYDAFGRLLALSNENGEAYRFSWDAANRLQEQRNLDGSAQRYAYDGLNDVVRSESVPAPFGSGLAAVPDTPAASIVHALERDAAGRLMARQTSDGRTEYTYDALDRLMTAGFTSQPDETQRVAFVWDAVGNLIEEHGDAGVLQHRYDESGNLSQTGLPDGRWLNRLHYGSGHLHQINLDGKVISDFERDRLHREVMRSQGALHTTRQYDRGGHLRTRSSRLASQPPQLPHSEQTEFGHDAQGNLVERTERRAGTLHQQLLQYDATGRIVAVADKVSAAETFAYDAAANLLDGPRANGYVVHNRLLTYQDKRYRYDAFGRLQEKRSGQHTVQRFSYDAEHRVREIRTLRNGREDVVRMLYDPLGRRIAKVASDASGHAQEETRFVWERLRLLQEHRFNRTSLYVYADGDYDPLARVDGYGEFQRIRYYHTDTNGLPDRLSEADGTTVWHTRYQVWGNTLGEVREAHFIEEQNLRFEGQYLDRETGLHYNTFRFYDPDIGRFITPDPIGLDGGLNLYAYAPNPMTWIDPLGWSCGSSAGGKMPITRNNARQLLRSRGRNKVQQHEVVNSFEGQIYATRGKKGEQFTITEHTPGDASQVFVTRGSAGATPAERRANLALPPNNSATHEGTVALTRDQVLLEGKVAPQLQWGSDKVGGGWQVVTAGGRYSGATTRL